MTKRGRVFVILLILFCVFVGWVLRGIIEKGVNLDKAMAWGYNDENNVWNRIRVDTKGYVMCHKE
jgi:hypothetical protein